MNDAAPSQEPRQTGWPGLRARLFHFFFLLRRPMTLGVRIAVYDEETRSIFLIRHTYVPGWQLPGGGVESGETIHRAMERELLEEANMSLTRPPVLVSVHFNRHVSRRDHVVLFLARDYVQESPKQPDHEIAGAGFFPVDALPEDTTAGTRRRIAELFGGGEVSPYW
jgi:8-oxo-dGTP pyrophosphatase MutT (NUDIX family)